MLSVPDFNLWISNINHHVKTCPGCDLIQVSLGLQYKKKDFVLWTNNESSNQLRRCAHENHIFSSPELCSG